MSEQTDNERIAEKYSLIPHSLSTAEVLSFRKIIVAAIAESSTTKDAEIARLKEENENYGNIVTGLRARLAEAEKEFADGEKISNAACSEYLRRWRNSRARELALESQCQRMRDALEELHTQVKGECPSLLNEDSGGDAELDLEIQEILSTPLDLELFSRVIKVLEMSHDRALDWDMLGRAHGNSAVQMWRESADALLKSLSPSPNPAK